MGKRNQKVICNQQRDCKDKKPVKKGSKKKILKKSAFKTYLSESKCDQEDQTSHDKKGKKGIFSSPSSKPEYGLLTPSEQIPDNGQEIMLNDGPVLDQIQECRLLTKERVVSDQREEHEHLFSADEDSDISKSREFQTESMQDLSTDADLLALSPVELILNGGMNLDTSATSSSPGSLVDTPASEDYRIADKTLDFSSVDDENADEVGIFPLSASRSQVLLGINKKVKIFGCACIKVIKGMVELLGSELTFESPQENFYAPVTDHALVVEPLDAIKRDGPLRGKDEWKTFFTIGAEVVPLEAAEDFVKCYTSVLLCSSLDSLDLQSFPGYCDVFKLRQSNSLQELSSGACLARTDRCFECFPSYITACDAVLGCSDHADVKRSTKEDDLPVILTVGGKGTGKSTFNRYLINRMLQSYPCIAYLDCDIGQPEFTPPGFVSLTCVRSPLFGPPFTHLQDSVFAIYYGRINCAGHPDHYVESVKEVLKHFDKNCPLLVNTMGWNRGLGMNILMDIIRMVCPTHLVQMSGAKESKNLPLITRHFVEDSEGWCIETKSPLSNFHHLLVETDLKTFEVPRYNPSDLRNLRVLAYLHKFLEHCRGRNLNSSVGPKLSLTVLSSLRPYKVKLSDVLCVCHESGIRKAFALSLFNASLVGLSVVSKKKFNECSSKEYLGAPPVCKCYGLGIVRGVDKEQDCLYIVSYLPDDTLKSINCLSLGCLSIPECLYNDSDKLSNSDDDLVPPYLSLDFPFQVTGSGKFRVYRSK